MSERTISFLSPEQQLLVCCARTALDGAQEDELRRLLRGGIDHARLLREAERHGLTPLVSRHLHALAPGTCAPEAIAALRDATQQHVTKSLTLVGELLALLAAFRAEGIDALPIKGPVSAAMCYGDLGLRAFSDLDLLVARDDVPAIARLLTARDYVPHLGLSPALMERLLATDSELLLRHGDGLRMVDVHWSLLPRGYSFSPTMDAVFSARSVVQLGHTTVSTLSVEATLLFLILHGMKHDFACLGWLCDIAELVRRTPALDWDAVLQWSAHPGRRRYIDLGLALMERLLGAGVPAPVLARGRHDREVEHYADELTRRLFAPRRPRSAAAQVFDPVYFRAMALRRDRARYVHDYLLRPTVHEWQALPLPAALAPLYYAVRPLRLLAKHARIKARTP